MRAGPTFVMVGVTLVAGSLAGRVHAEAVSLRDAVERLQARGEVIIYSDDLVRPDVMIDPADPTLAALDTALATLGLRLERVADHWVITRGVDAASTRLHIRSASGLVLEDLRARWRGQSHPLEPGSDGGYTIPLAAGSTVTIDAAGHQPQKVRLSSTAMTVVLAAQKLVEKVIVTGTRHRLGGGNGAGSLSTLTENDLATVPALGGDAMRAVATLPGMSSVGVSAKPWIRGGLQDELLVEMDGVELLDAYHLADFQSLFSIVDDRSVAAVDVYTGGFPARYGNRMSGVMDITTGRASADPQTEIGVSLFSLLANRQGTANDGDTWYLGSVRRGNLDQVIRLVDSDLGRPRYYDAYGRVEQRLNDAAYLSAGALLSADDVSVGEDATQARSSIDNRYLWTRLELDPNDGLQNTSTLALTWSRRDKSQNDFDDDSGVGGLLQHRQALWKLRARTDFRVERAGTRMEFGAQAEYGHSRYDSTAQIDRGVIGAVLGNGEHSSHDIHVDPEGWSGGVYWSVELPLSGQWLVQPGIRWDFQSYDPEGFADQVSPRLGIRFTPDDRLSFHVDVGRFHQPREINELQVADGESRFFRAQRSDHFIAGFAWQVATDWKLSAEAYAKRYQHTSPRYENVFNPFVLVPELEPDRLRISPDRARARGADVELSYRPSADAYATLHYGYMDAEDRIDDDWIPRRWSQRHTLGGIASWRLGQTTASLAVTWHSGWRGANLPASVSAGSVLETDVLNDVELDEFLSVDVGLQRTWTLGRSQITASASVTNVTDHDNVAGIEYDAQEEDGLITFEPRREPLLPLVPSVGVLITF